MAARFDSWNAQQAQSQSQPATTGLSPRTGQRAPRKSARFQGGDQSSRSQLAPNWPPKSPSSLGGDGGDNNGGASRRSTGSGRGGPGGGDDGPPDDGDGPPNNDPEADAAADPDAARFARMVAAAFVAAQAQIRPSTTTARPREPKVFTGTSSSISISQFLQSALDYLELTRAPEDQWVRLTATYFDGDAAQWWSSDSANVNWEALSWEAFRERCYARWSPVIPENAAYAQLIAFKQNEHASVQAFTGEFNRLLSFISYDLMPEKARVTTYMLNILHSIRKALPFQPPATLHEAQSSAAVAESQIRPNQIKQHLIGPAHTSAAQVSTSSATTSNNDTSYNKRQGNQRGRGGGRGRGNNRGGGNRQQAQISHTEASDDAGDFVYTVDSEGNDAPFLAKALAESERFGKAASEWAKTHSPAELKKLRAQDKCFRCKGQGHNTADCKNTPHTGFQ